MMRKKIFPLVLVFLFVTTLAGCSFSVSTANVKEVYPCKSVDSDGKPVDETDVFSTSDTVMYVSALTANITDDTIVRIAWMYNDGSEEYAVDEIELTIDEARYIQTHLNVEDGFPIGTYLAEFYINDREEPDKVATITVK